MPWNSKRRGTCRAVRCALLLCAAAVRCCCALLLCAAVLSVCPSLTSVACAPEHHNRYEKLQRWEDALEAYERKQLEQPSSADLALGRMRCLRALGEWDRLAQLSSDQWVKREADPKARKLIAPLASAAAWHMGRWSSMSQYLSSMEENLPEAEFFAAIHAVHQNDFKEARKRIDRTRELLDPELTALVGESYTRAYRVIVQVQQIAELEEVMTYKECDNVEQQALIRKMWAARLNGCQRHVDVWQQILAVRALVVSPKEDIPTWYVVLGVRAGCVGCVRGCWHRTSPSLRLHFAFSLSLH
jgi:phosphatidylinositol kinase/protein kinase (PI-3  family)